jgi:hypothetical protein
VFSELFDVGTGIDENPICLCSADSVDCEDDTLLMLAAVEMLRIDLGGGSGGVSGGGIGDTTGSVLVLGVFGGASGFSSSSSLTSIASSVFSTKLFDSMLVPRSLW